MTIIVFIGNDIDDDDDCSSRNSENGTTNNKGCRSSNCSNSCSGSDEEISITTMKYFKLLQPNPPSQKSFPSPKFRSDTKICCHQVK